MPSMYAGLLACVFNLIAIPLIIFVSHRRAWFDKVDARKIHKGLIPRLGGVGIFWSVMFIPILFGFIDKNAEGTIFSFWPVAIAMFIVHFIGLIDDFYELKAKLKFIVHVAAASIVVYSGYKFTNIYLPGLGLVQLGWLSWPLTIVWIVGVINALNMIDGMDGLSGGISLIAAFTFGLLLFERGLLLPYFIAITVLGSLTGYLFYNFPPAKIFMGDSGSTFLGFVLAVLPLMDKTGNGGFWIWDAITILLLPIFDVFAAIIRRAKKGQSLMHPDRWHFHHKLLRLGLGTRAVLAIAYTICMLLGVASITVLFVSPDVHFILIICTWLALFVFFLIIHYIKENLLSKVEQAENSIMKE